METGEAKQAVKCPLAFIHSHQPASPPSAAQGGQLGRGLGLVCPQFLLLGTSPGGLLSCPFSESHSFHLGASRCTPSGG